jgi:hypothetical protein
MIEDSETRLINLLTEKIREVAKQTESGLPMKKTTHTNNIFI